MKLPNVSTYPRRFAYAASVLIPLYTLYQVANHRPIFHPRMLPTIFIDRWMPFWPETCWIYIGMVFSVFLLLLVRNPHTYFHAVWACGAGFIINLFFWFLLPTTIDRPTLPPASQANLAYRLVVLTDSATNCFPSGHITIPLIVSWAFVRDRRPATRRIVWPLFALGSISVLTTKQHYFVDIPGGLAVGLLALWIVDRAMAALPVEIIPHRDASAPPTG
jgi:hypothetical protein